MSMQFKSWYWWWYVDLRGENLYHRSQAFPPFISWPPSLTNKFAPYRKPSRMNGVAGGGGGALMPSNGSHR